MCDYLYNYTGQHIFTDKRLRVVFILILITPISDNYKKIENSMRVNIHIYKTTIYYNEYSHM